MPGYKYLILTDLDGTLLNSDDRLSALTLDYVHKLNKRDDVLFAFSTGRSWEEAKAIYKDLQLKEFVSCCNGSLIHNPHTNSTIYAYISEHVWKSILLNDAFFKNFKAGCVLTDKEIIHFNNQTNRRELIKSIDDSKARVYKVKVFINHVDDALDQEEVDDRLIFLKSFEVPPYLTIYRYSNHKTIDFEIQSPYSSKERAVEFFSNHYGVPRKNILTFGDQINDLPVAWGTSFFTAVKNAVDLLKYGATNVSRFTNDEDSVIKEIDIFLKKAGVL